MKKEELKQIIYIDDKINSKLGYLIKIEGSIEK